MSVSNSGATLYRLFDADGALLYVGCSVNPFGRFQTHKTHGRSRAWWCEVAQVTFEHYEKRADALAAEAAAIVAEAPRFNVVGDHTRSRSRSRAAKVAMAQDLRSRGLKLREIAAEMGVATSTAQQYLGDPDLAKVRARKASYGGICAECGAKTDGSNGRAKAPRLCHRCRDHTRTHTARWTEETILAAIGDWVAEFGEPPASPDWNPVQARVLNDEARALRFERAEGRWPHFQSVVRRFGTWSAAIEAAGFTPREAHGGGGNELRRRNLKVAA